MSITVNFSPADTALVREQAITANISIENFIHDTVMEVVQKQRAKNKRNNEYLAKIDRGLRSMQEGSPGGKYFANVQEMREYFYGSKV